LTKVLKYGSILGVKTFQEKTVETTNESKISKIFTSPFAIVPLALLCCALWGSATPFIKIGYALLLPVQDVPSTILFAGIRFALAGVITVIIYSIARRRILYPKLQNLGRVGALGAVQTVIQYIFFYLGLGITSGVKGTIASGSSPFFALLISALIFKQEKLNVKKIIACALGFAGIILINVNGLSFDMNIGDLFVIFSAISLAVSSVLMKRFSKHEDPVVLSGYQFILGGIVMVAVGLILGGKITVTSIGAAGVLIYLAFLSAIAYAIWGMLLKYNHVSKITVFSFATPVFGVILSTLMLSENSGVQTVNLIITLLLVSAGIFLLNYQPNAAKTQKAVEAARENSDTQADE
jgi:drug/metabolite transporter (DMT)-like permease